MNNPAFAKTPFYLIFNKKDLFESKIRKDPITVCESFADYTGSAEEVIPALDFIDQKFKVRFVLRLLMLVSVCRPLKKISLGMKRLKMGIGCQFPCNSDGAFNQNRSLVHLVLSKRNLLSLFLKRI